MLKCDSEERLHSHIFASVGRFRFHFYYLAVINTLGKSLYLRNIRNNFLFHETAVFSLWSFPLCFLC